MSPGLHDSQPASISHIEQEPVLSPNNNNKNITQLSNPNGIASPSSTTLVSLLEEGTKSVAVPYTTLHRSVYIPVLVLGYTALAIFAWLLTCILSYRPITTDRYDVSLHAYGDIPGWKMHLLFVENQRWFRVARVIQSIVVVLTIPLTSAVCSKAAVVFVQRQGGLSLRQAMTLADKGWTEPKLYAKLLFSGGLKRYGSSFLFFAILLNILGGIISPLQSIFLTSRTIKTPTSPGVVDRLTDILDLFNTSNSEEMDFMPALVRSAITYTSSTDVQSCLWTSSAIKCGNDTDTGPTPCALGGVTLGNMSLLPQPFLAQLPSGYNTGLIRQFLPRINSSATREVITEADFPANCETLPGSFYVNYANGSVPGTFIFPFTWSLIACMPANQNVSPWKPVRTRQDFSEELYLKLSVIIIESLRESDNTSVLYKITMNTTAGFFELPNYMNGQLPGPLLDDDPSHYCDSDRDCIHQDNQGGVFPLSYNPLRRSLAHRDTALFNRGPLLTTAIALFGDGSFIADRVTNPDAYINNITESSDVECISQVPLVGLLYQSMGTGGILGSVGDDCVIKNAKDGNSVQRQIKMYINLLMDDGELIRNAFESAAFLANEAWLKYNALFPTFAVSYDAGTDTVVPAISRAGINLISLLLAVDLLSLLAMTLYSAWTPCWTDQLDAFAMVRIGAAIAESIPFRVANTTDQIKVLDETPGWVGDATEGRGKVGELGIGASTPLRGRRKYACY
ncbi:hypothetical protein BYT27DRAFT_6431049 [Phlegmacium glaucopus]|nr:hypothetical protein BYT27DRAFT_6431049 [Phlegmacium glaucopus]